MSFQDFLKVQEQGLKGMSSVGTIGLHLVSGPLVGLVMGYFLDEWLDTGYKMKIIFLFLGIGVGFLNVYRDTRLLVKNLDQKSRDGRYPGQPEQPSSAESPRQPENNG